MSATRRRHSQAGFTLPEVLVTLMILSLFVMTASAAFRRHPDALIVEERAHSLAAELRKMRTAAMAQGTPVARSMPGSANAEASTITFFADGSSTGGTFRLTSGGQVRLVQVEPLTAKVSVAAP